MFARLGHFRKVQSVKNFYFLEIKIIFYFSFFRLLNLKLITILLQKDFEILETEKETKGKLKLIMIK